MTIAIEHARTEDLPALKQLLAEYVASLGIDLSFQDFDTELQDLFAAYVVVLVARDGDRLAGCVCLRTMDEGRCEMKRLYVRPEYRGQHLGRQLVEEVLDEARRHRYTNVLLDTLATMHAATRLYRSFGFVEIGSYRFNPVPGARYFQLAL